MRIAIVGSGYVGLVTGTCLAEVGHQVTCVDVNEEKVELLQQGITPIFEPGLEELLKHNLKKGKISFTTSLASIINTVDVVFTAVGTPPDEDGSADLKYVLDVAHTIGKNLKKRIVVVTKSTVPVGTAIKIKHTIQDELDLRNENIDFDIASNPEFLKEGDAINDFMKPDRIVIGVESDYGRNILETIYKPFVLNGHPIIVTDIRSAEMIKYAANAMLATRISFMNDIANLCEIVGANINMVRQGIGADSRIGNKFLYAGIGYGGSCFPKDVKALIQTGSENNYSLKILKAVEEVNEHQKSILFEKLNKYYDNNLKGKTISILGLAFKPKTDDMREAPSLVLIDKLIKSECKVQVYDPIAIDECKRRIGNVVSYCSSTEECLQNSDALFLVTEWNEFRTLDFTTIKKLMNNPVIFDGRNIFNATELNKLGIHYFPIGYNA